MIRFFDYTTLCTPLYLEGYRILNIEELEKLISLSGGTSIPIYGGYDLFHSPGNSDIIIYKDNFYDRHVTKICLSTDYIDSRRDNLEEKRVGDRVITWFLDEKSARNFYEKHKRRGISGSIPGLDQIPLPNVIVLGIK